ncbi:unnamed protein product, partial [Acanthocheilonema viteae]
YFCDRDYDEQKNNESVWQVPSISAGNNWSSANDSVQQLPTSSEPVFSSPHCTLSSRQERSDRVHGMHHHSTFIDDPLGLSGSLFGRGSANIWASDPRSTAEVTSWDNGSEPDPNSAAVYWTEMFLADDDRGKCP